MTELAGRRRRDWSLPGDAAWWMFAGAEFVTLCLFFLAFAVKRADEQAFAQLNGQNLMYVEDAARRIQQSLSLRFPVSSVSVRHLESLHPHDAVASVGNAPAFALRAAGEGRRP